MGSLLLGQTVYEASLFCCCLVLNHGLIIKLLIRMLNRHFDYLNAFVNVDSKVRKVFCLTILYGNPVVYGTLFRQKGFNFLPDTFQFKQIVGREGAGLNHR